MPPALFICEVFMHPFIYFEQNPMASRTKLFFPSIATSNLSFTSASFTVSFTYQFTKFKANKLDLFAFIFAFISIANIVTSKHHYEIISTSVIAEDVS